VVQERLGHSSIETTLNRYSHVMPNVDKAAAEEIAAYLA
jgi:integrase